MKKDLFKYQTPETSVLECEEQNIICASATATLPELGSDWTNEDFS